MDELEEDEGGLPLEELLRIKEAIYNSLEKAYEYKYIRLKNRWLSNFDQKGEIEGRRGNLLISRVISHYEKKDSVDAYERCAVMKRLLDDYNLRFPRRYG